MTDKRFVRNIGELIESTMNFFDQPEYWPDAVGTSPKYFTHYIEGDTHYFGLSKFCAFRNVQLHDYIMRLRNTTNGNITQRHITKIAGIKWIPFSNVQPIVGTIFTGWIHNFFPA